VSRASAAPSCLRDSRTDAALSHVDAYSCPLGPTEAPTPLPQKLVAAAYVLTPYIPNLGPVDQDTPLPGRLFHPEYGEKFRLGAVTLRPGMTAVEINYGATCRCG
jgi:hypothetical protein